MNNLEKIEAAAKMGYAAQYIFDLSAMKHERQTIIGFHGEQFITNHGMKFHKEKVANLSYFKIVGYVYVSHLFGNPIIPEFQKFISKVFDNKIFEFAYMDEDGMCLRDESQSIAAWPWEVEPVFD